MAAILNSAISEFWLKLIGIRLKLIHSHLTWWWQPSSIWPSWIQFDSNSISSNSTLMTGSSSWLLPSWMVSHVDLQQFCIKLWLTFPSPPSAQKNFKCIHSHLTWWWKPSWILPTWIQTLPSWIQTPCYLVSDSFKNTLTPLWLWIKVIQYDSKSFLLM